MLSNMWSLFVGTTEGVTDDEEEEGEGHLQEDTRTKRMDSSSFANLRPLQSTRITPFPPTHQPDGTAQLHRIPSPTREQGDGMEAEPKAVNKDCNGKPEVSKPDPPVPVAVKPKLITLPQTNIQVDRLPPITADREVDLPAQLPPDTPLVQMTSSVTSPPHNRAVSGRTASREPKFVPYEPYKAAVTNIVPKKIKRKTSSTSIRASSEISPQVEKKDQEEAALAPAAEKPPPAETTREDRLVTGLLEEANAKVRDLEASLSEAKKQLKIQTQVNAEVKKLLVASVGEDIEARVDYLTQDKARLAADIRQYSNKICKDFEEKEKLSVESDLWKSKFLACSVIVDELARSKVSLVGRSDEYDHHLRLLLHERSILWQTLDQSCTILNQIKAAFDPLAQPESGDDDDGSGAAASVLGLADATLESGRALRDRLVTGKRDIATELTVKRIQIDTPAESGLRELMAGNDANGGSDDDYSTKASIAVTGAARPHLAKINDKLSAPNINSSQFKCCTHCKGTIHTV